MNHPEGGPAAVDAERGQPEGGEGRVERAVGPVRQRWRRRRARRVGPPPRSREGRRGLHPARAVERQREKIVPAPRVAHEGEGAAVRRHLRLERTEFEVRDLPQPASHAATRRGRGPSTTRHLRWRYAQGGRIWDRVRALLDLIRIQIVNPRPLAREVQRPPIRRPGRPEIEGVVVGDEGELPILQQREVAPPVLLQLEGDPPPVRRDAGRGDLHAFALEEGLGRPAGDRPAAERHLAAGQVHRVHHRRAVR